MGAKQSSLDLNNFDGIRHERSVGDRQERRNLLLLLARKPRVMAVTGDELMEEQEIRQDYNKNNKDDNDENFQRQRQLWEDHLVAERELEDLERDYSIIKRICQGSISDVYLVTKNSNENGRMSEFQGAVMTAPVTCKSVPTTTRAEAKTIKVSNQRSESTTIQQQQLRRRGLCVMKQLDLELAEQEDIDVMENEIDLLATIDHPNIVKAHAVYRERSEQSHVMGSAEAALTARSKQRQWQQQQQQQRQRRNQISLVMEYCSGGNLSSVFTSSRFDAPGPCLVSNNKNNDDITGGMSTREEECQRIVAKIIEAVHYLHKRGIAHSDLRPENILFEDDSPNAQVKIIDFGLAQRFRKQRNSRRGGDGATSRPTTTSRSLCTMSPEMIQGKSSGVDRQRCDMWSVGAIAYYLLSGGREPFRGQDLQDTVRKITRGEYDFSGRVWDNVSSQAKSFVKHLLRVDPRSRYTSEQALRSPWLFGQTQKTCDDLPHDAVKIFADCLLVRNDTRRATAAKTSVAAAAAGADEFREIVLNSMATGSLTQVKPPQQESQWQEQHAEEEDVTVFLIRDVFHAMDVDHDGRITYAELKRGLKSSCFASYLGGGSLWSEQDIKRWFEEADVDKDGTIDYTEFLAAALEVKATANKDNNVNNGSDRIVEDAFVVFDREGEGNKTRVSSLSCTLNASINKDCSIRSLIEEDERNNKNDNNNGGEKMTFEDNILGRLLACDDEEHRNGSADYLQRDHDIGNHNRDGFDRRDDKGDRFFEDILFVPPSWVSTPTAVA